MAIIIRMQEFLIKKPWLAILIVVCAIVFVASVIGVIILCLRKRRLTNKSKTNKNTLELNEEEFKDNI